MARKTTSHGLSFIAAYTFSKTLTDTDSALFASGSQIVQDFYNRKAEKAIASFDFPQVVKLTWIYELPFGRGRKWLNAGGGSTVWCQAGRLPEFKTIPQVSHW